MVDRDNEINPQCPYCSRYHINFDFTRKVEFTEHGECVDCASEMDDNDRNRFFVSWLKGYLSGCIASKCQTVKVDKLVQKLNRLAERK